jgi:hypothetical protein
MTAIFKVGFEIEGGWAGSPGIAPCQKRSCCSFIADHSINGQTLVTDPLSAPHIGECVSDPIQLEGGGWQQWILDHWPNADPAQRTNNTCGYHVHISLKSMKDYTLLTSKAFLYDLREHMLEVGQVLKLPKSHPYWGRIHGKNNFCGVYFDPARQMQIDIKTGIRRDRYGWLNFSWGLHGTMEFRALPTFRDAPIALRCTEEYLVFVENWLARNRGLTLKRVLA